MTEALTYLAYATTGKETEVENELQARGFKVWCGRKVEFVRKGKRRRAEAVESPKLPNYLFITMTADEWHRLHSRPLKHLAKTTYVLRRDDEEDFAEVPSVGRYGSPGGLARGRAQQRGGNGAVQKGAGVG